MDLREAAYTIRNTLSRGRTTMVSHIGLVREKAKGYSFTMKVGNKRYNVYITEIKEDQP